MKTIFDILATRAADLNHLSYDGDKLANAVISVYTWVADEVDAGTIDPDDDDTIKANATFIADGLGFTFNEIMGV
jgi:hypothetical protein